MDKNNTTLVVVEDEMAVRRSIIGKIRRENLHVTIQGEFQNAEDAYLHISDNPPEIILLDMRMPGMGGMKFLEILNREFPDIQVIVLSGYSEFKYLQKAIKCGAKDYLLKPVVREELRHSIEEAITRVRKLKNSKQKHKIIKNNLSLVKADLLHRLIHDKELSESEILQNLKELGEVHNHKSYLFINGQLKEATEVSSLTERIEKEFTKILGENMILSNLGDFRKEKDFQLVFAFEEECSNKKIPSDFKPKLEKAVNDIGKETNIIIHISISSIYKDILNTKQKYKKSMYSSLTVGSNPSLFFFEDSNDTSRKIVDSEKVKEVVEYVKKYNRVNIISSVNKWFMDVEKDKDFGFAQRLAIDIVSSIENTLESELLNIVDGKTNYSVLTFYDSIKMYKKIEDIKYKVIVTLCGFAETICKKQKKQCNDIPFKAKKMIEEKYKEEITLEFITNQLHINKSYFSELFKKEIGLTFNKYLNWVRIEKAKELLIVHDMNASKVSEVVGYKDHVYFSIVFKKFTGLPPGEFKQKYKNNFLGNQQKITS